MIAILSELLIYFDSETTIFNNPLNKISVFTVFGSSRLFGSAWFEGFYKSLSFNSHRLGAVSEYITMFLNYVFSNSIAFLRTFKVVSVKSDIY